MKIFIFGKWAIVFFAIAFLIGCATTPNKPYSGPLPDTLSKLDQQNPRLVEELKKLPEIRDGISQNEIKALEAMAALYQQMPKKFDAAFEKMYQIGKPDVRKYCSPLQALFWLAQDKKTYLINEIVENYRLDNLLDHAWKVGKKFMDTDGVTWILFPPDKAGKSEVKKYDGTIDEKWTYDKLIKRLNAPELISFWERKNISYEYYLGDRKANKAVFKSGKANCRDLADFSSYLLNMAGYDAKEQCVESEIPEGHSIVIFKNNGKIYTMDNTFKSGISGPFDKIRDIPYTLQNE